MLIEEGKLNIEEFKKFYHKLEWLKAPRVLGTRHKDFFFVGKYEDKETIVEVSIRPSMRMQIKEIFKNLVKATGKKPTEDKKYSKKDLANFGQCVEVLIDEHFKNKIEELAEFKSIEKMQKMTLE